MKLWVTLDGWNEDREEARPLNVNGFVSDYDIATSVKTIIQNSGEPPSGSREYSGEYRVDDGPWFKWTGYVEYDWDMRVTAKDLP